VGGGDVAFFPREGPAFEGVIFFGLLSPLFESFDSVVFELAVAFFGVLRVVFGESGELAHEGDEVLLDTVDPVAGVVVGEGGADESEGGVEFINSAKGFDAGGGFGGAFVEEEVSFARVAAFGD